MLQHLRSLGVIESRGRTIDIPSLAKLSEIPEFDERYLHRSEAIAPRLMDRNPAVQSPFRAGEAVSCRARGRSP